MDCEFTHEYYQECPVCSARGNVKWRMVWCVRPNGMGVCVLGKRYYEKLLLSAFYANRRCTTCRLPYNECWRFEAVR